MSIDSLLAKANAEEIPATPAPNTTARILPVVWLGGFEHEVSANFPTLEKFS